MNKGESMPAADRNPSKGGFKPMCLARTLLAHQQQHWVVLATQKTA
jgi:hypothetical protein